LQDFATMAEANIRQSLALAEAEAARHSD
jgi:hypothetical protein